MPYFSHIFFHLLCRCYQTTCRNTGDGAGSTSLNSHMRMVLNVTDGLGLVSLSPTACDSQSQPRLTLLPSSSLHVSVKRFYDSCQVHLVCLFSDFNPEELCAESGTCSLWGTHKLALHSACFCFQGGMCSGCCCLCVLSSAGVSACCLCLFFVPQHRTVEPMSHQRWVCKKQQNRCRHTPFVVPGVISEESDSQA